MSRWNIFKAVAVGLVLLLLYLEALQPNVYMKLWFAILWCTIAIVTIIRAEARDWLAGDVNLKLPLAVQLAFVLLLLLGAVVATDWTNLGRRDLFQWMYVLFTIPIYRQVFAWARSHLR